MRSVLLLLVVGFCLTVNGYGRGEIRIEIHSKNGHVNYTFGNIREVSASKLLRLMKEGYGTPNANPIGIYPDRYTTFVDTFRLMALLKRIGWSNFIIFAENGESILTDRLGLVQVEGQSITDTKRRVQKGKTVNK